MTLLLYINPYAALYLNTEAMTDHINNLLSNREWIGYTSLPEDYMPENVMSAAKEMHTFFHGVAMEQIQDVAACPGMIFVNPMYLGLIADADVWKETIHNRVYEPHVAYVDIPYDVYQVAAPSSEEVIGEDEYNSSAQYIQELVNNLSGMESQTRH